MSQRNSSVQDCRKMLTFESLIVKELQKQQSRAEFCDIVLQTQGVSVPVHSCVLSAFSPWLCGALSTMPSPHNGQKRLIEVKAVEACTLLSLVSLLYSGQFYENKEKVLSAAHKLGINIPTYQQPDITVESKSQESKAEKAATEQHSGHHIGTQTEFTKAVERECQTGGLCVTVPVFPSEGPHPKETVETVNMIGVSSWRTDQELCTYATPSDITLTTLQNVQGIPEISIYTTDHAVPKKRKRGRPHKCPLPLPNPSPIGMLPSEQNVSNTPASSLMHISALPAANQKAPAQPMEWFIDDVIAQLPLMVPSDIQNNQDGIMNTATSDSHPRMQSSVKLSDLGMVQSQPEGELTDMLYSFLRTFDQHVAAYDIDNRDGIPDCSQNSITDQTTNAYQHTPQSYTAQTDTSNTQTGNYSWFPIRTSSMNTTPQVQTASLSHNRQGSVHRAQKPSISSKVPGIKEKKMKQQPSVEMLENRSQSRKRRLRKTEEWPWRKELPLKQQRQRKKMG